MITGMMLSPSFWVFALNCLQNSMMLTPCCPSDGPTGGAGFAFPAGICNLICADTSLAMSYTPTHVRAFRRLNPFHLQKPKLNRSGAPKNTDQDFKPAMVLCHLVHHTIESEKGTVDNPHIIRLDEFDLFARPGRSHVNLLHERFDLVCRQRCRLGTSTDKSRDLRRLLDHLQRFIDKRGLQLYN